MDKQDELMQKMAMEMSQLKSGGSYNTGREGNNVVDLKDLPKPLCHLI